MTYADTSFGYKMLYFCTVADKEREPMGLIISTRRLTPQPSFKNTDSRCSDRHGSATHILHQTCITSDTPTIISKLAEPDAGCNDVREFASHYSDCGENLRVRMQRCAGMYESGCSVLRGFTSQDAVLLVELRVRILYNHCTTVHCTWTSLQTY